MMTEELKIQSANDVEELTLDMLTLANEKYANLKEILIEMEVEGKPRIFRVGMYKAFSPFAVKDCVMEFIKNISTARIFDKDGFGDIQEPYLMWLLIKHFTTIGESLPSDFSKQLDSLKVMINNGIFFQMVIHFDEDEVAKINTEMNEVLEAFVGNKEIFEEIKNRNADKITDKSILE